MALQFWRQLATEIAEHRIPESEIQERWQRSAVRRQAVASCLALSGAGLLD